MKRQSACQQQAGGAVPTTPSGNVRASPIWAMTRSAARPVCLARISQAMKTALIARARVRSSPRVRLKRPITMQMAMIIRVEDGKGNSSYSYYDKAGRKILSIDPGRLCDQLELW